MSLLQPLSGYSTNLYALSCDPILFCHVAQAEFKGCHHGIYSRLLMRVSHRRSLRSATPDFLLSLVALVILMRLSLTKAAHLAMSSAAWQEIRVRYGRDDKGGVGAFIKIGHTDAPVRRLLSKAGHSFAFRLGFGKVAK